jgi:hypothetical protein
MASYHKIDEIIKELEGDTDVSLLQYQILKKYVDSKINTWGTKSGIIYRLV